MFACLRVALNTILVCLSSRTRTSKHVSIRDVVVPTNPSIFPPFAVAIVLVALAQYGIFGCIHTHMHAYNKMK